MGYKSQTNVLLIGEISSANVGDQIIGLTVHKLIKKHFSEVQVDILDLSGRDVRIRELSLIDSIRTLICCPTVLFHNYHFPNTRRIGTTIRYFKTITCLMNKLRLKHYEIIIFDGGAIFQDYFAELLEVVVNVACKHCEKIIFHACGLGMLSEYSVSCLNKVFRNEKVTSISLRDSFQRFAALFPDIPIEETYDTAIGCSRLVNISADNSQNSEIGLGCISTPGSFEIQVKLVNALKKSNYTWKLFTTGEPSDYRMAEKLLTQCGITDHSEFLCDRPLKPEDLIKDIIGFDSIISFRMHSLVIGASFGVPITGIVWDDKVRHFLQGIGLDHHIDVDTTLTGEEIISRRCVAISEETKKKIDAAVKQTQNVLYAEIAKNR